MLGVLGRASVAGFIISSLIIVTLISRSRTFAPHADISLATSFIFAAVFGTIFVSSHYAHRRIFNTILFIVFAGALAGLLTYRVFG